VNSRARKKICASSRPQRITTTRVREPKSETVELSPRYSDRETCRSEESAVAADRPNVLPLDARVEELVDHREEPVITANESANSTAWSSTAKRPNQRVAHGGWGAHRERKQQQEGDRHHHPKHRTRERTKPTIEAGLGGSRFQMRSRSSELGETVVAPSSSVAPPRSPEPSRSVFGGGEETAYAFGSAVADQAAHLREQQVRPRRGRWRGPRGR